MNAEKTQKEVSSRAIHSNFGKGVGIKDNRPQPAVIQRICSAIQLVKEGMYSGEKLQKFRLIERLLLQEARGGYSQRDVTHILSGVSSSNMDIILSWNIDYIKGLSWNLYALEILRNPFRFSLQWKHSMRLIKPLISLVNSIIKNGILSSQEAREQGIGVVTSADRGTSDKISVNTFALVEKNLENARKLALESMGASKRGSITVSLERQNDQLLASLPKEDEIELTCEEKDKVAGIPKEYQVGIEKILKKKRLLNLYKRALETTLKPYLDLRAQGTIMILLDKATTGISSTNVDKETGLPIENSSQEVTVEKKIEPARILEIMLPIFMLPYKHLIQRSDIIISFVDKRKISAYYTTPEGEVQVNQIIAPDYVEGIARQLIKERVISTHIVTTSPM